MKDHDASRRGIMQLLAATMVGSAVLHFDALAGELGEELAALDQPKPVYIPPGQGKKGNIAVNEITFKLTKQQTSGNLGSAETTLQPGYMGAVPHRHQTFDEVCRVLQGTLTIMVEEEVFEVAAGGWHLRPRGLVHSFWNSGKVPATFIELYTPDGHEAYMEQLTALFVNGRTPKPAEVDALARKHDIEFFWERLPALLKQYNVRL